MKTKVLAFVLGILICHTTYAQKEAKKESEIRDAMWKSPSIEFKATEVPDKWKNESAVLLAIRRNYICEKDKYGLQQSLNLHYRIKLQDKAAVKEFSEISFNSNSVETNFWGKTLNYRIIGIKVVKAGGQENEVNLSEAVKEDASSNKELKIPIPNLEPGDIIDYFAAFKGVYYAAITDEEILELKYPVVKQTISFNLYDKLEFVSKSLGGAPGFNRSIENGCTVYTLEDNMREKAPDLLWNYEYRTAPNFRYRVRTQNDPTDVEVYSMRAVSGFSHNSSPTNLGLVVDFMHGNFRKEKDPQKITYELYYLLRNPIYLKTFLHVSGGDPLKASFPTDFFVLMDKALSHYKISHDIMLAPSRSMGPFEDIVNLSSCDYIIRVNTNPVIYISRPTPFSTTNEIDYKLQGTTAAVSYTVDNADKVFTPLKDDNLTAAEITVSVDDNDKSRLNIQRHVLAKGNAKSYYQHLVTTNYDYLKAYDQPKYLVQSSNAVNLAVKDYNKEKQKLEQRAVTDYNERDKRIIKEIESDMEVKVSNYKMALECIGMWHTDSGTAYNESFTIENVIKKAGANTIVELGKLIEKQIALKDTQLKRTRDIYVPYPSLSTYDIVFTIPDGYTAEGIENFNMNVENATGGFASAAKMEGKNLVIHVKKYFVANYYPATDWEKITAFSQSSNNFYNAKLLLKKSS